MLAAGRRPIVFLAAVASLITAAPPDADACSPPVCADGFFSPGDGATVPANLPTMSWRPMRGFDASSADLGKVVLTSAAAPGTPLPFTATQLPGGLYEIVPDQPLTPGAYVLADQNTCGSTVVGPMATFQVADAAPLPTSLGALVETKNLVGPLVIAASASCSSEVEAHHIELELQLGPEAAAWGDALHFETLVDGEPWRASSSSVGEVPPGSSWRGRGVDRLYRVCKAPEDEDVAEGLSAGPHEVVMRATLRGSDIVVSSSSLTVELACPAGPADPGGTGGCDAGGSGSSGWLLLGVLAILGRRRRRSRGR